MGKGGRTRDGRATCEIMGMIYVNEDISFWQSCVSAKSALRFSLQIDSQMIVARVKTMTMIMIESSDL